MKRFGSFTQGLALCGALVLGLSGCGSDSSQPAVKTGYLVDSNVSGVSYSSGAQKGTTSSSGKFTYEEGTKILFTIGGVKLGELDSTLIKSDSTVYPAELVGVDRNNTTDTKLLQMIQLLQSLDSDGNPDNGIDINDTISSSLSGATLDFTATVVPSDLNHTVQTIAGQTLKTKEQALRHYKATLVSANIEVSNDTPNTSNQTITLNEDTTYTFTSSNFTDGFSDIDGDSLTKIKITTLPTHGTLKLNGSTISLNDEINSTELANITYVPSTDYHGSDSFVGSGYDGSDWSSDTTMNISVASINDTPVFTSPTTISVDENQTAVTTLSATDDSSITYSISGADSSAFVLDATSGELSFKTYPEYDYKSSYTLIASASDGTNDTNQTLTINIGEVYTSITGIDSFTLSGDGNWTESSSGVFTSADISGSEKTCMELNSTLYTSISFDWNVSSENNYDFSRFYINDDEKTKISGSIDTTTQKYTISKNDMLKWCYTKDGSGDGGSDNTSVSNIKLVLGQSPTIISTNTLILTENETFVMEINATDKNNDTLTYSIENNDSSEFDIDSSTGEISFKVAPSFDTKSIYHFTANVSDGVNKTSQDITLYLKSEPFTHNGTVYQAIKSSHTGKIWLDRNIGASKSCESFDDTQCYGDYYQWGRNSDGHEKQDSNTTATQATDIASVGHSDFITSSDTYSYDWAKDADSDGSQRENQWLSIDGSSVCPVGYRVPTIDELADETVNLTGEDKVENRDDAYNSFLRFPSAGYRSYVSGSLGSQGDYGNVWSSSPNSSYARNLDFFSSNAYTYHFHYRANGLSVRCLKN